MKRALENFNTEVFVSSTIYYEKEDIQRFLESFSNLTVIDFRLAEYIKILEKLMSSGDLDNLPKKPANRKNKIISLVSASIDSIADSKSRDKISTWFNEACEKEYDLELQDELFYRYCWSEFFDRVNREDESDTSFADKLSIRPNIPDIGRKQFQTLEDIVLPSEDEDISKQVFPTGISSLDEMVQMRRTNFVVIAARASIGKSLFMINQALHNAASGNKTLYVSLEESDIELKKRMLIHIGAGDKDKYKSINENLIIFTPSNASPNSVLDEIARQVKDKDIKLVFIDYIQLMKYPGMSDWDSLRSLTRDLKLFAIKNNILLVTASQLKREVEYTGSNLASLYGSSTIEADANVVIMLEPVRHQNVRINNTTAIAIIVAKNRTGAQGKIDNVIIDYSRGHIIES
jgi:replicative DNA helicase